MVECSEIKLEHLSFTKAENEICQVSNFPKNNMAVTEEFYTTEINSPKLMKRRKFLRNNKKSSKHRYNGLSSKQKITDNFKNEINRSGPSIGSHKPSIRSPILQKKVVPPINFDVVDAYSSFLDDDSDSESDKHTMDDIWKPGELKEIFDFYNIFAHQSYSQPSWVRFTEKFNFAI